MKNKSFKNLLIFFLTLGLVLISFGSAFAEEQTIPNAPINLAGNVSDSQVNLTWLAVTGATYYNVYKSLDGLTYNLISTPTTVTKLNYGMNGLINGKSYYFKITAINAFGESSYSNVINVTPLAATTPVNIGTAGNYAILSKAGISTVPNSAITGNIGVSPIDSTAITGFSLSQDATTGFSTSTQITGKAYAPDYSAPTPSNLTTAVGDMGTAYTDAAGRAANYTELYTGDISGKTLTAGVYKWSTGVLINSDVILKGGVNDVFIFEIAKGITQANNTKIILSGGVQAKNIFWQSAKSVSIGTGAHFEGNILGKTNIALGCKSSINGRLLAQTAVTLIKSTVVAPSQVTPSSVAVNSMEQLQSALVAGVADITIAESITTGSATFIIPSGTVLRDYFKIGFGNTIIVNSGAMLRRGNGIENNLLVGDANSTANLALATGATFTVSGALNDNIATYLLNGTATVTQQNTNPFLIAMNETFTIATGATLNVASATDTDLANVRPALNVDATGGKLVVNGTLNLLAGSRIFLGNGLNSILNAGTITNNAGTYDNSVITGIVGILDANHNVLDVPTI